MGIVWLMGFLLALVLIITYNKISEMLFEVSHKRELKRLRKQRKQR